MPLVQADLYVQAKFDGDLMDVIRTDVLCKTTIEFSDLFKTMCVVYSVLQSSFKKHFGLGAHRASRWAGLKQSVECVELVKKCSRSDLMPLDVFFFFMFQCAPKVFQHQLLKNRRYGDVSFYRTNLMEPL